MLDMAQIMAEVEKAEANPGCVQCGYCCSVRPCYYGVPRAEGCAFLMKPDEIGRRKCMVFDKIEALEHDSKYPMMGCGCSSTAFN